MEGNGSGPDRTAFVLTGGGSLGAVQVGMLYALLEAGVALGPAPGTPPPKHLSHLLLGS